MCRWFDSGSGHVLFITLAKNGILAQSVEHLTFNQVVRGSNPRCLMKSKKSEEDFFFCVQRYKSQYEFLIYILLFSIILIRLYNGWSIHNRKTPMKERI